MEDLLVELIILDEENLTEDLFQRALTLVDDAAQTRIKRFYHRADAWRTLIGRLLPRMLLYIRGVRAKGVHFGTTDTGKPYILASILASPLAFNVSHDRSLVAIASASVHAEDVGYEPAYRLGVDVMCVRMPLKENVDTFLASFVDQLGPSERKALLPPPAGNAQLATGPQMASDRLHTFFRIWTLKEAFTKALGLGLGFDFSRLDFDLTTHTLTSDNTPLVGWALSTSDVLVGGETYIGAIARFVGGSGSAVVQDVPALPAWKRTAASEFLINAIDTLHE